MIKRYFVRTRELQEGMRIDQSIVDRMDRTLIAKYTILDQYMIDSLKRLRISGVYVSEGEEEATETDYDKLPAVVKSNLAKYREPDPAKVQLTDTVKKRVSSAMQYLYNNTECEIFMDTTHSITGELLKAIDDNDALAVDISVLKTSDEYTFKHSVDVATVAMIVAKKQGLPKEDIHNIGIAGLLHDIGKSKIPLEILNKPGRLDDEEFAVMKRHSEFGYEILKNKEGISPAIALAVLQHHEKMNGKGYPFGYAADKIIPYAKILSVADVYDALVTERPYKKPFTQRNAIELIMSMTEELDLPSMRSFLNSVILYPVDSTVQLSTGENARVVKNNAHSVLRPTVVGLETGKVYDLTNDFDCANIIIQ